MFCSMGVERESQDPEHEKAPEKHMKINIVIVQ